MENRDKSEKFLDFCPLPVLFYSSDWVFFLCLNFTAAVPALCHSVAGVLQT